ncbi:CU044_5270 family protein [Streptomyces sp. P6-2-1]|uniref:CU044_5270 family protein n=1 Tax=Streptomyces sp. P6-2-1 TaxID=3422591 RepID=UPI003D369FEE
MGELEAGLRDLDPARGTVPDARRREERLDRVLAAPRPAPLTVRGRRPVLGWGLAAGVVVAVTATVLALQLTRTAAQPATAVTPPPLGLRAAAPAAPVLTALADKVGKLPEPARAAGPERFVRDSWSLSTRVDGVQVTSAVIPEHRVTVKQPDGSTRWTVRTLKPRFGSEAERARWEKSGSVGAEAETYTGAGGPSYRVPRAVPTSTAGMRDYILPGKAGRSTAQFYESLTDLATDHHFTPAQRAAVLRVLAESKGVEYRGEVKDRAGRTGLAFSHTSRAFGLRETRTFVFDPADGRLLSADELLLEAGRLNVRTPAIVQYTTYLE